MEVPYSAYSPIVVTRSGMTSSVRLVHLSKAQDPIEVTLSGMVILVSPVHP